MNEARISLTPYCNYRCFFCHNEGLAKKANTKPRLENLRNLISKLLGFGYDDLTFTGGEPFLYPELLIDILSWMSIERNDQIPAVTIVSNGSLIKEEHLKHLKKYPKLKFHISLHTSNPAKYFDITKQKRSSFDQALNTLQIMKDLNFDYKINYVLLRTINTSEEEIRKSVELAEQYGAKAIKFLELLVLENNAWLFPYFFDINSAEAIVSKFASHKITHNRRKVYRTELGSVDIELQQLTCKIGCSKCMQNRDHTFSATLQYFPCMEASNTYFDLNKVSLPKALQNGKKIIQNLSKKYGQRSPSLLQETRYIQSRKELFFALSKGKTEQLLKDFVLTEQRHFKDWYYQPRTADKIWHTKQRQIKIRQHITNEYLAKIIGATVIMEEEEGLKYQRIVYWDEQQEIFKGNIETAFRFMEGLDMMCWHKEEILLQIYRYGKIEITLSQLSNEMFLVGINLKSFSDLNAAKRWLRTKQLPLKGQRLLDLLLTKKLR